MRTVLLLTVIFVTCAAAAQSDSPQAGSAVSVPQLRVPDNAQSGPREFKLPTSRYWHVRPGDLVQQTLCLKIRSYIFERRDGEAPRLVGMTTCTPSTKFTTKRAESPQWGVYPAVGSSAAPAVERRH